MAAVAWPDSDEDEEHYINMYNYNNSEQEEEEYYLNMYDYKNSEEEEEEYSMNMFFNGSNSDEDDDHYINTNLLSETVPNEGIVKKVLRKATFGRWAYFKWLFLVLNVLLEVCQATMAEENAKGKISKLLYLKMSIITSCLCLVISMIEMIKEGKDNEVVWRRRGYCCWFYYVGIDGKPRVFGRFSVYFGVVSSMIQLVVNSVSLMLKKSVVQFDLLPVLLSSAYLVAEIVGRKGKSERTMV